MKITWPTAVEILDYMAIFIRNFLTATKRNAAFGHYFAIGIALIGHVSLHAQTPLPRPVSVLFIGNSYTYYNNLPEICIGMAASTGKVLVTDQSTVGGYSLAQHLALPATIDKIKQGIPNYNQSKARTNWNYVVVQEHSTRPSFADSIVGRTFFADAHAMDSIIHAYNADTKTIFYQTWGRKNGDSSRCATMPSVCTYLGMDSLLAKNYQTIAMQQHAMLAPVGAVWRALREKFPAIELYNADQSHPSEAGSYAAACCFYAVIFREDPAKINYDYTLSAEVAAIIRRIVKEVVYNQMP